MNNELRGAFDVVAEFSVPAINRVLAAMDRGKRLMHSASFRVDDRPHSVGTRGVVDLSGLALTTRAISPPQDPPLPGNGFAGIPSQVFDPACGSRGAVRLSRTRMASGPPTIRPQAEIVVPPCKAWAH